MNNEQHVTEFIPDFLLGNFDTEKRELIQSHLRTCTECQKEFETLSLLWNSLGELPQEKPSAVARERFNAMLTAYEHGLNQAAMKLSFVEKINSSIERFWPKQPVLQFAITFFFFVVGGFAGMQLNRSEKIPLPSPESTIEIAQLHGEVRAMSRMLAVSLMQQQSASERLRGINLTSQFQQPDGELTSALFEALNYDPNVNVRLAAIDALQQYGDDPTVRKRIIEGLTKQDSPIVQMALIDLFVSLQVRQSKPAMEHLLKSPKLNIAVKSRIELALNELEG